MSNENPDRISPILTVGLRPFFLVAGGYAVLAMTAWMVWLGIHSMNAVIVEPTIAVAAHLWHGHEMLFGYAVAVASGFMLTAVPNWTGTQPVSGMPLLVLVAVWFAGRIAVWFSSLIPATVVAAIDMAYLPLFTAFVAVALSRKPAARNLIFILLLALLIVANAAIHAEWLGVTADSASRGLALAIMTFTLLMVIVGGRIVPAFTRNALMKIDSQQPLPVSITKLDVLSIASVFVVLIAVALELNAFATGLLALVAAGANAVRFSLWRGFATLRHPILWSLHLGYAFVPLGLAAMALSRLTDLLSQTAAMHVLAIGAVGCLTLAVMTRAALGQTGRALRVIPPIAVSYVIIALAALVRGVGLELFPMHYYEVIFLAGGLWIAGFAIFTVVYAPMLIAPPIAENQTN